MIEAMTQGPPTAPRDQARTPRAGAALAAPLRELVAAGVGVEMAAIVDLQAGEPRAVEPPAAGLAEAIEGLVHLAQDLLRCGDAIAAAFAEATGAPAPAHDELDEVVIHDSRQPVVMVGLGEPRLALIVALSSEAKLGRALAELRVTRRELLQALRGERA